MNSSMKKIFTTIDGIGSFPRKVVVHGIQFSIGLVIIALVLRFINNEIYNFNYYTTFITFITVKTSVTIFAQAVIGGLLLDWILKKI